MRELALLETSPDGVRLLGRVCDEDLIVAAAERIAAARRREISRLEGPVRLVPPPEDDGGEAA